MVNSFDERAWTVSTVELARRYRFGIVIGEEATAETDPVADSYRAGSLAHMATLIEIAQATLSPGDRVLDLGAHLGGFALTAAALGCEVLAVEASPRNAALLKRSTEHNRFDKLHVIHAAVGEHGGAVEFSSHGPWGHVGTQATGMPTVSVAAVKVDDLLDQHGWESARFVKLDVEGSEVRAVRGMQRLLGRSDAPIIHFESNQHTLGFYGQTDKDLKNELRRFGYVIYEMRSAKLLPVRDGEKQLETCMDYLAAKRLPPQLAALKFKFSGSLLGRLKKRLLLPSVRSLLSRIGLV